MRCNKLVRKPYKCQRDCQQAVGGVEIREAVLCKNSLHKIAVFIREYFRRLYLQLENYEVLSECSLSSIL